MNTGTISLALCAAVVGLASACGSSSSPRQHRSPPVHRHTRPTGVGGWYSCPDITTDLNTVVSDLKSMDTHYQEAWVSGGDSADLQALINNTANAVNGADQLNTDAATFNADATSYLSGNSPFLAPGWQTGYSQVTDDINAMATDCGLPTATRNTPANSRHQAWPRPSG